MISVVVNFNSLWLIARSGPGSGIMRVYKLQHLAQTSGSNLNFVDNNINLKKNKVSTNFTCANI